MAYSNVSYSVLGQNERRPILRAFSIPSRLLRKTIVTGIVVVIIFTTILWLRLSRPAPWPKSKLVSGDHGVVAAEHPTCSQIGVDVLKEGGSAVDAAIASAFCIGAINGFSSGIGG